MVQAKDLRIGNLVFDEDNDWCQIAVLYSEKKVNFEGYSEDDFIPIEYPYKEDIYSTKVINPIPLSSEVLEMCGFDMYPDWTVSKKDGSAAFLDLGWLNISMSSMGGVGLFDNDGISTGVNIKYLHQLQNLYYELMQSELIIKL